MSMGHDAWRDLVLSYEDLTEEERARADLHLADCESCRTLLARIRDLMSAPGPRGELPSPEDAALHIERLDPRERAAAAESLAALRHRLGAGEQATGLHARRSRGFLPTIRRATTSLVSGRPRWRALVPAVAVAAVLLLLVSRWTGHEPVEIRELRVVPVSQTRGIEQEERSTPAKRTWRNGEAFRVRFELTRVGHPFLFHVDPAGVVTRIYPEDPGEVPAPRPADEPVELPPDDSAIEWIFEGEPGPETFLLAVTEREELSASQIEGEIAAFAAGTDHRERLLRLMTRYLEGRGAVVRSIEVDHVP